jgi:hypothetical protein
MDNRGFAAVLASFWNWILILAIFRQAYSAEKDGVLNNSLASEMCVNKIKFRMQTRRQLYQT